MKYKKVDNPLFILALIMFALSSCASEKEQIMETSKNIVKAVKDQRKADFKKHLAFKDLSTFSKDEEMLDFDMRVMYELLKSSKMDSIRIEITDSYDELGKRRVILHIDKEVQHAGKKVKPHINLLFGPKSLFPYSKITGYQILYDDSDEWEFSFDKDLNSTLQKY